MSGFMLRRSLLSLTTLATILVAAGGILVALGVPVWVPLAVSFTLLALQYAFNPRLIEWLIPADVLALNADGDGYATEHPVGAIVGRRCAEAGIPLVTLGIVDDGTPNAFTFGHFRRDARVWLTKGLLERLDDAELDAVVSHEIGHVANHDFVVMTFAAGVPILAYYAFLVARGTRRQESLPVVIGAYAVYMVSSLVVLSLARAREVAADRHSCQVTGDGDALCRALVKIAYGMGQVRAEQQAATQALQQDAKKGGWKGRRKAGKATAKLRRRQHRVEAMRVMGIADPHQAGAVLLACEEGLEPGDVLGALRWDTCNPWARFQELLSSHPVVVHRIAALERSGLPGAPTQWSATATEQGCQSDELSRARQRFAGELIVRFAGPAAILVAVLAYSAKAWDVIGWALLAGGCGLAIKALLRRPPVAYQPVDQITSLLQRLDASPVSGLAVSLRGHIIGRATPGYRLSPDLVVQDYSGFVPVLYRQPIPFSRSLFGALRAGRYQNQEVLVRGWYRRAPTPIVELHDLVAADGTHIRSWQWVADYLLAAAAILVGAAIVLITLTV